jgi:hypothetical protein
LADHKIIEIFLLQKNSEGLKMSDLDDLVSIETLSRSLSKVTLGSLELYFSFRTLIGLKDNGSFIVGDLKRSRTTSRHLTLLEPEKKKRISYEEFEKLIKKKLEVLK